MNDCYDPVTQKCVQKLMLKKNDIVKKLNRLRKVRR
jgi:hypothetical protein